MINFAPDTEIIRVKVDSGKREFLIGCNDFALEPTFNIVNCWPKSNVKSDTEMIGIKKLEVVNQVDRKNVFAREEVNVVDFPISCVSRGTAMAELKCTRKGTWRKIIN